WDVDVPGARLCDAALVRPLAEPCVLGAQPRHDVLELEHPADAGEVEPLGEQLADPEQPLDVRLAVEPGAAAGPVGVDQTAALVDAEVLDLIDALRAATEMANTPSVLLALPAIRPSWKPAPSELKSSHICT